jgi:hypothetical protein
MRCSVEWSADEYGNVRDDTTSKGCGRAASCVRHTTSQRWLGSLVRPKLSQKKNPSLYTRQLFPRGQPPRVGHQE